MATHRAMLLRIMLVDVLLMLLGAPARSQHAPPISASNLTLPTFLASHMVLQRSPQRAKIWGWGTAGSEVSVTLNSNVVGNTTIDSTGNWTVVLPKQHAGIGHTISVSCPDGAKIDLVDIAFGDVYICTGKFACLCMCMSVCSWFTRWQYAHTHPLTFYYLCRTEQHGIQLERCDECKC